MRRAVPSSAFAAWAAADLARWPVPLHASVMDLALGSPLPSFSLPGVDGRTWSSTDFREPVLVLVVTCNHCPVAIAYEDRLIALARAYQGRAAIVAINPNDATT